LFHPPRAFVGRVSRSRTGYEFSRFVVGYQLTNVLEEPVPPVPNDVLLGINIVDSVQNDAVDVVPVNVSLDSSISVLVVRSLLDVNIMEAARFPRGSIQPHKRLGR